MKLVPYERFTIHTQLRAAEALRSLKSVVVPYSGFESQTQWYRGKIEGHHFKIRRNINRWRYHPSTIVGDIQPEAKGCSICITMYPHGLNMALMTFLVGGSVWLLFASLGFFIVEGMQALMQPSSWPNDFWCLLGSIFLYPFLLFAFKIECSKATFRTLFQADRVDELEMKDLIERVREGSG